jgi:hypothetical protein
VPFRSFTTILIAAALRALPAQQVHVMAQAIPLFTRADPTAGRRALDEGYLTEPIVMAHGMYRGFGAITTLDFEGLTLRRGELTTGNYGEGYIDRRHPHTYIHELMLGGQRSWRPFDGSIYAGRGFVPFGSDDPMSRPLEKYPVNHHLSQVLERVVAIAAVRAGPVVAELGAFNGDEPIAATTNPQYHRFGDSWSARLTYWPKSPFEFSASGALVASPEQPSGHGLDQRKANIYGRWRDSTMTWSPYALVEWSHTTERDLGTTITTLNSVLAEGSICRAGVRAAARVERTDRPEEEPLLDPFRTARPANDLSNLGISRWTVLTGSVAAPMTLDGWGSAVPFVEVAHVQTRPGNPPGLFSAELRYGSSSMWMYSVGVRLSYGAMRARMGRYGVASGQVASASSGTMTHQHGSENNVDRRSSSYKCAL